MLIKKPVREIQNNHFVLLLFKHEQRQCSKKNVTKLMVLLVFSLNIQTNHICALIVCVRVHIALARIVYARI